jgi:hypothetical protein
MITHLLSGGLGNQLFQIYTTISLSIKLGHTFSFQNKKKLGNFSETIRNTYWDSFFVSLLPSLEQLNGNRIINYREKNHSYEEINVGEIEYNNLIVLNGYFQSYKYFEDHQEIISSFIGINDYKRHIIDNLEFVSNKNSVSLHFRIGDYKYCPNHHLILDLDYYRKSLLFVSKSLDETNLIINCFYEEEDDMQVSIMIQLLQMEFETMKFVKISTTIPDWKQLLIMSLCDHNIIANSTFSLWSGMLNTNQHKIVCYPSIWFGKNLQHNDTYDMFPNSWIKILL